MEDRGHEWDLLEQAHPISPKPFGFVCGCGEVLSEGFATFRDAVRAAERHAEGVVHRPAA
jgi:hypothetical protein